MVPGRHETRGINHLVNRELAVTLLGADRARRLVDEALGLGILDLRDGRLELHPLVESFIAGRTLADTRANALEAFPSAWAYYTGRNEPDAAFDLADQLGAPRDIDRLLMASMDELLKGGRLSTLQTWVSRAVDLVGDSPAVLVAQAEIALRRGHHLTAQALADRAARSDDVASEVIYRAHIVGARAAHIGQREEDALALYRRAEAVGADDRQRRTAKWGRLTAAASLELQLAHELLNELEVVPRGEFDPTEAVRTADKKIALGLRFGTVSSLADARSVEELVPSVSDPFVRSSFRCMFSYALSLASEYEQALSVAGAMTEDAAEFRIEFVLPYASLMRGTALVGLRRFGEAHEALNDAHARAIRCTDAFGLQAVYSGRVRAFLQEGRVAEACGLEPPDLTDSLPGMRGEVWASRGLALACIGRLSDALQFADLSVQGTRGVEATVLAQCIRTLVALKARQPDLSNDVRQLMSVAWDAGAVDCVVTGYRASPDLLAALFRDGGTAERAGFVVRRASDQALAASVGVDLDAVLDPVSGLSVREREVYDLLCEGLPNREIAGRLFISVETVKVHARHVYDKLGIRSRTALALHAASRRQAIPTATLSPDTSTASASDG